VSTELDLDVSNVDFGSLSGSFGPFPGDGNAEFETTGSSGTVNLPAGETVDIAYALDPEQEGTFSLDDNLGLLGDGLSFDVATLTSTIARVTGGGSVATDLTTSVTASARIEYDEARVVPVPAALPLMLGALGGLGFLGWRKRQA